MCGTENVKVGSLHTVSGILFYGSLGGGWQFYLSLFSDSDRDGTSDPGKTGKSILNKSLKTKSFMYQTLLFLIIYQPVKYIIFTL